VNQSQVTQLSHRNHFEVQELTGNVRCSS